MAGRYVVVGAGAVGATVAAQLHLAGTDVVLIARGSNLDVLRAKGLRYMRPDGVRMVPVPVAAGPGEVTLRPDDVLVLAVKSQNAEEAIAEWAWQPVVDDDEERPAATTLPLVLMQNGLDTARTALRRFATVVDSVVLSGASHVRPGEVVSPGSPLAGGFYLGDAPTGAGEHAQRIAVDLRAAEFAVQVVPDIARWKVGKLLANLWWNLDALYRRSRLRSKLGDALCAEAEVVLEAAGYDQRTSTPDELDRSWFESVDVPGHRRGGSSTWQSLARGGSAEGDYLYGEIVLLARMNGLRAPLNEAVQARLATMAQRHQRPRSLPMSDIADLLGYTGVARPLAALL
ncbi:2-dehydropantoate 2-reductase [Pseudonocardia sulfidoxydans NBRC 16205]|uniref:2-dehydropantoate 2-reductase n=2 Tax=Pseudonocardia sulfidoxydans TaxID=54011 RepID=A0A511DI51_9PSEU|nr:2-dehydropantoate 2-reductase N-terminal domain-containing protein [Pseudonocardia sulfidoxydans]GEL24470.1 2-dehydropantoate 2-reductase [Pseudonocardia sulfidoxydans NBRC 16205]